MVCHPHCAVAPGADKLRAHGPQQQRAEHRPRTAPADHPFYDGYHQERQERCHVDDRAVAPGQAADPVRPLARHRIISTVAA